ncbi:MAG: hydrogenase maturation peptidase HycI [Methanobacteriota archaeon]
MHLLLGIGNDLLADDGIGCLVADRLHHPDWQSVIAGTVPENFTRLIREVRPDILLLVDAAQMNLTPGSIRIIPQDRVVDAGIGTHQLPLDALCDVVSPYCGQIIIIGIQPGTVEIGEEMTQPVTQAGKNLISHIIDRSYMSLPLFGSC